MADYYPYLVASLPMLHFGMKPPFSSERFLDICCPFIPEKDCRQLRTLPQPPEYSEKSKRHPIIRKWVESDSALRNDLVRTRAVKKHLDPAAYLRPGGSSGSSAVPAVLSANVSASLLDTEMALDGMRWKALEDLSTGHYFDLAVLVTYAYQLRILERWEKIRSADGETLLGQALQR